MQSSGIKVTSQGIISYCPDKKSLMGPMTKYDQEYTQELCSFALIQNTNYGLEFQWGEKVSARWSPSKRQSLQQ